MGLWGVGYNQDVNVLGVPILKPIVSATATTLQAQQSTSGQNLREFLGEMNKHQQDGWEGESRLYYKGVELANCSQVHLKHFEHLKESYLERVRGNLLDRFPSSVLEAISSFSAIFNPKCYPQSLEDIGSYGVSELNFLLQVYSRVVVSERALSDFPLFKRIVFSLSQLSFKDLCVKLVYSSSEMHELFPDFAVLAAIALALPLGSVLAEKISRGRELLRRGRSRHARDEGLSDLMKIAIDGPAISEFNFALAIECYESMRESGFIVTQVK